MIQANWKDDAATRRFIAKHADELNDVSSMSVDLLVQSITYCRSVINPFSEELTKRAGNHQRYITCRTGQMQVVRKAAQAFGYTLI